MDAMDEFQEADILWPDTEDDDELVPFASMGVVAMEVTPGSASSAAPVFGRRLEGERFFHPGTGPSLSSAAASPGASDDDEEWLEADVLWPDTVGTIVPHGGGDGVCCCRFPAVSIGPAGAGVILPPLGDSGGGRPRRPHRYTHQRCRGSLP